MTNGRGLNTTALIIAGTVVFVVVIIAITSVAIAVDDGARAASLIALILAPLTTLLGMLAMFIQVMVMRRDLGEVKGHTEAMTNGLGDAKIRANVADVLRDDLIDPDAARQIDADRRRRAAAVQAGGVLLERAHDEPDPTHRKDTP